MVNAISYIVKAQPHNAVRWSANVWEKFGQAKKAIRDAYLKATGRQPVEVNVEESIAQISHVVTKTPKYHILQKYRTTIGGYAGKVQQQMAMRSGGLNGGNGYFSRDFLWRRLRTGHLMGFATLFLVREENKDEEEKFVKRIKEYDRLCEDIKKMFNSPQKNIGQDFSALSASISDYKFGECVAVGSNGAVYDVEMNTRCKKDDVTDQEEFCEAKPQKSTVTNKKSKKQQNRSKKNTKLAIKMIFNYDSSNAGNIYRQTKSELITCGRGAPAGLSKNWQNGSRSRMKDLPYHPNIIQVMRAFVDKVPNHPDFGKMHPASLQHPFGYGRSSTMFLVMKRYKCTLEDYLKRGDLPLSLQHILSLQLLQGVSHLEKNCVAHRDLKSNNVFIDFDSTNFPRLVIGDFGCSIVAESNTDLIFPFPTANFDIRNGNPQIQPPEIQSCEPGPDKVLDYRKSDAWAAGLLLCEIMGYEREQLNHTDRTEQASHKYTYFMKGLIKKLLNENPSERVTCTEAANILYLEMFGPKFESENQGGATENVKKWLLLHACETLAYKSTQWGKDSVICDIFTDFLASFSHSFLCNALVGWQSLSLD